MSLPLTVVSSSQLATLPSPRYANTINQSTHPLMDDATLPEILIYLQILYLELLYT